MPRYPAGDRRGRVWLAVSEWVRTLRPGQFGFVMATGIVADGLRMNRWMLLSRCLVLLCAVALVVLLAGQVWRLVRYPAQVLADEVNPARSFAFFTFSAAANVLANDLAKDALFTVAAVLVGIGTFAWLLLGYVLPLALITRHGLRPALAGADGTWFLWVVAAQSCVVAATALPAGWAGWLAPLAVAEWSVGVVLYLAVAVLVLGRLFAFPVRAAQLTPSYWVFMGATAISALAGARLLDRTGTPLIGAISVVVAGFSVLLWAFGTWTIPVLLAQSLWWERARLPVLYEPGLWNIVFPVGMYGVASHALGKALGVAWMARLGSTEAWAGGVVWLLVFVGMLTATARAARRFRGTV